MSRPTVSVLMTAYNREKYIAEAIESVLASSFTDFELIIVDDCSADSTVEIARPYLHDKRVQLHINEQNLGDYPNRNRAAELASGKYIKYLDSDDIIHPHGLDVMVYSMEKFPKVGFGISRNQNKIKKGIQEKPFPIVIEPEQAYQEHFFENGLFGTSPLSTIICADAFVKVKGFSGKRQIGDLELWLKLGSLYPMVKIVPGLGWWRSHGKQEFEYDTDIAKDKLVYEVHMSALASPDCPLTLPDKQYAIKQLKGRYARTLLNVVLKRGDLRKFFSLRKQATLSVADFLKPI